MEVLMFMLCTAAEPAPQEKLTEAHETHLSGSEPLRLFVAVWEGGESTAFVAMPEEYEASVICGSSDGSVKLLGNHGASEHCLDDRPGLRELPSDCARPGTTNWK